jgi:hypothetical protein
VLTRLLRAGVCSCVYACVRACMTSPSSFGSQCQLSDKFLKAIEKSDVVDKVRTPAYHAHIHHSPMHMLLMTHAPTCQSFCLYATLLSSCVRVCVCGTRW